MRSLIPVSAALLALLLSAPSLNAGGFDDKLPDAASIAALEVRAAQAQPKEQCYLYAELLHQMIEYSSAQYAAGQFDKATTTLHKVHDLASKIHMALSRDEKRLKNTQILLRHTAFRLTELLHSSDEQDRPLVEQTLAQLNQVQTETMMAVFRH
jgi:hypothetical protein